MDTSKQPEYPCFDITIEDWNNEEFVPLWDEYTGINNEAALVEYANNRLFVDCNGEIYKIVGFEKLVGWRRYVPFVAKYKLVTEYTGQSMTLEDLKAYILSKVDMLDWNADLRDIREEWRVQIIGARSFVELIAGAID